MTRKDYIAIAAVFKVRKDRDNADALREIAYDLADVFKRDNPNFDRARFLAACGVQS